MVRIAYRTLIVLAVVCTPLYAADWPCWRGPQYDGISRDTSVTLPWKENPTVLWEAPVGKAFSGVTGTGDLIYTCGTEDDKVYIFGGKGTLLCADAKTGDEVWSKKFGAAPKWMYSGSVLVEGDLAVVSPGGEDGGLLALDKNDGEVVWTGGTGGAAYATPYPFTFEGGRYIVGFLGKKAIAVDAKTGREVWSMPWVTKYDVNAATPIFHDGHLFLSSGYGHGCILVKLAADGDRLTSTTVWESKAIMNKFQTCILLDGKLYGADERNLKCVDFLTGEEAWSLDDVAGDRTRHATLVLCGDQLIFFSEKGQLSVAKASPKGFEAVGSTEVLSGQCWTVPTLHNGRIYVRNLEKLVCLDLGG